MRCKREVPTTTARDNKTARECPTPPKLEHSRAHSQPHKEAAMHTVPDQPRKPGLLTPDEFYNRLRVVGKTSIYAALQAGRIRHLRIGRKILVLESELEEWPRREAEGQK
jgi:excisionase family DNA binding protein